MKLDKESLSQRRGKWGYGEIGRRYGLDRIEPWYGNLPSDSFQIQGTLGYFEWVILSQIRFMKTMFLLLR